MGLPRKGSGPYRIRAAPSWGLATGVATLQAPQAHVSRVSCAGAACRLKWARDGRGSSFAAGA
ncbi:MAG TPA: hypothetical protein ENJ82_10850 [Bacteroidetes bacterium]|nr:hypothetical protein [Bacteroidota bacterium]